MAPERAAAAGGGAGSGVSNGAGATVALGVIGDGNGDGDRTLVAVGVCEETETLAKWLGTLTAIRTFGLPRIVSLQCQPGAT